MTGTADPPRRLRWYESVWVMAGAGYIFPPLGIYLMWRFQSWPVWLKTGLTVGGSMLAIGGSYLSSTYVMPRVF